MALLDTIELRIHFDELTNLDLLRKGLYRVQATIEWTNNTAATPGTKSSSSSSLSTFTAVPYTCVAHPLRLTSVSKGIECIDSDLGSEPSTIDDPTLSYFTRSVYMRYTDEQFNLNEWVSFRLSIPRDPTNTTHTKENVAFPWEMDTVNILQTDDALFALDDNIFLPPLGSKNASTSSSSSSTNKSFPSSVSTTTWQITLTLQRADCIVVQVPPISSDPNQASSISHRSGLVKEEIQRTSNFVAVSTRTLTFPHSIVMNGLHTYMPIVWDSMNLAESGITVESSFVNTFYETPNVKPSEINSVPFFGQPRERVKFIRNITNNNNNASGKGSIRTRTPSTENSSAASTTDASSSSSSASGTGKRSWTERWSSGITTAAMGLASIVLSPPTNSIPSFTGTTNSSSSFTTPGTSTALGSALSFLLNSDTPIDRHLDGLTNECKEYVRTLSTYEQFPLTSTEAYFPYIFQQRSAWRTNRRRQLVAALRLLEQTALDDNQENSAAETAAQEIVQDTLRTLHVPFIPSTLAEDQIYVSETESLHRYIYLLSPFFYNYYRLAVQLHKLTGLTVPTTLPSSSASSLSYVPFRFSKGICTHALDLYNHLHRQHHHSYYVQKSDKGLVQRTHSPTIPTALPSVFQALLEILPVYTDQGTEQDGVSPGKLFVPPTDVSSFHSFMISVAQYFRNRTILVRMVPDTLSRCIQHDIQLIAEEVNALWRTVQRETSVHMRHILMEGQIKYRALAILHIASTVTYHIIPPAGIYDPRASQHNSQEIKKSVPCKNACLLDPIISNVPQILDVTVSIVGHSPVLPLHSRSTRKFPFSSNNGNTLSIGQDTLQSSSAPERMIRGRLPSNDDESIAIKRPYLQMLAIDAQNDNSTNKQHGDNQSIPSPLQDEETFTKRKGMFQVNPNGAKLGKSSSISSQDDEDHTLHGGLDDEDDRVNTTNKTVADSNVSEGGPSPLSDTDTPTMATMFNESTIDGNNVVPIESNTLPTDPIHDHASSLASSALVDIPLFGSDVKQVHLPSSSSFPSSGEQKLSSSISSSSTSPSIMKNTSGNHVHVIFFLNGLGGSMHDSRIIRSQLKLHHPHIFISVTVSNQGRSTEGDLVEAGVKVAHEMYAYLSQKLPEDGLVPSKLSIIAFSLGGIVARIALRHPILTSYLPLGYAFLSIATPHLGVLYSGSVFSTGLYVLRQLRSSVAMGQLALTDEPTNSIRNSLLYLLTTGWNNNMSNNDNNSNINNCPSLSLSTDNSVSDGTGNEPTSTPVVSPSESLSNTLTELSTGSSPTEITTLQTLRKYKLLNISNGMLLDHFQKILLFASPQDSYAPYASCMAQICDEALHDKKHGNVYTEMVQAFYSGITLDKIRKVSVKFSQPRKGLNLSMDSLIGREAHVSFLDNEQMASFISLGLDNELWDCTYDDTEVD